MIYKYAQPAHKSIAGQMSVLNQKKYIGEFASNAPDGYGTMIYENGSRFVGYFKNGQRQGLGMELNAVSEDGKPSVNKGVFEGMNRIGPNWATNPHLEELGKPEAVLELGGGLTGAPGRAALQAELTRMRVQAALGGQPGAPLNPHRTTAGLVSERNYRQGAETSLDSRSNYGPASPVELSSSQRPELPVRRAPPERRVNNVLTETDEEDGDEEGAESEVDEFY